MSRIICDFYSKKEKQLFGDDPNSMFNQKIVAVNNMYAWLYEKGILEKHCFEFKDMENAVYFALNAKDLESYREEMSQCDVDCAKLAVHHIFDEDYTPCMYSGAIQLGWMMGTYRNVDGCTGRSWECDLIKSLNADCIYEVYDVRNNEGVKSAISKMFSFFDWPVIEKKPVLDEQIKSASSRSEEAAASLNGRTKENEQEL